MREQKAKSDLFLANYWSKAKVVVNQGGTSSGKTWSILDLLFFLGIKEKGVVITVVGQDVPNLKKGAYRDAKRIWMADPYYLAWYDKPNESDRTFTAKNGSIIEFSSFSDEQDARSGKRDYLFINEANGISYAVYWQLAIRTKKKIFLDYNPSSRFWVHDNLIGAKDVELLISDHRHNVFLTQEQHDMIEGISDKELWKVYARGHTGKLSGLILTNYTIIDNDMMPSVEDCKMTCFGLDFGFTNDPTALEFVCLAHGKLWIDEYIYTTQLTNPLIAQKAREQGITKNFEIIADSAEPKSIEELRNEGLWVNPSTKGKDSIINGIDILKRYPLMITRRSTGLLDNLSKYKWKTDKDGKDLNVPIDTDNHGIDAIRYVALARLYKRRETTYNVKINRFE